MRIHFQRDGIEMLTPCPHGQRNYGGTIHVNSASCAECRHFHATTGPLEIECTHRQPTSPCSCIMIEGAANCKRALGVIDKCMRKS